MGFRAKTPVSALPIFFKKIMGLRFAFSPPPKCLIPNLGIVINDNDSKQNTREKKYFSIFNATEDFIKNELYPDFIRIINSVGLSDSRPFQWHNYRITPKYTYFIPLIHDEDYLYNNMKGQIRTDIRRAKKYSDIEIVEGGRNEFFEIVRLVRNRYAEQSLQLPVSRHLPW